MLCSYLTTSSPCNSLSMIGWKLLFIKVYQFRIQICEIILRQLLLSPVYIRLRNVLIRIIDIVVIKIRVCFWYILTITIIQITKIRTIVTSAVSYWGDLTIDVIISNEIIVHHFLTIIGCSLVMAIISPISTWEWFVPSSRWPYSCSSFIA